MLPAQVSYWTLQEQKRHNLETERLTGVELEERSRHNREDERIRVGTLAETQRNNLYTNQQGDYSLGINAMDANTRRFSAVSSADIGLRNAEAARVQASAASAQARAAMLNAGTNAMVGASTADLNTVKAEQAEMTGAAERRRINAQTDQTKADTTYKKSQTTTEGYRQDLMDAQAARERKDTELADFYAGDRAKQTDIQQQRAYNEQFGNILNNLTPWR